MLYIYYIVPILIKLHIGFSISDHIGTALVIYLITSIMIITYSRIYYNNIYDSRRCGVNAFRAPRVRIGVLQSVVVYYYYIYIYWNIHPPIHPPIWPVQVFGVERLNVLLKQSLRRCLRKI